MQNRKPMTAVDRVRARLTGKPELGGSLRHRASISGYQEVEVALSLAYSQVAGVSMKLAGEKTRSYTKTFKVPAHKNPEANAVRVQLTTEAIASAKRENAALGEIRPELLAYRIVR